MENPNFSWDMYIFKWLVVYSDLSFRLNLKRVMSNFEISGLPENSMFKFQGFVFGGGGVYLKKKKG